MQSSLHSLSLSTYFIRFQCHEIVMFQPFHFISSSTPEEFSVRNDFPNVLHNKGIPMSPILRGNRVSERVTLSLLIFFFFITLASQSEPAIQTPFCLCGSHPPERIDEAGISCCDNTDHKDNHRQYIP